MSTPRLIVTMLALVAVGTPMVFYLWQVLTDLLSLRFDLVRMLVAIPVLLVFLAFLAIVHRVIQGWERRATGG